MRSILRHFPAKLLILLLFCFQLNKAEAQTTLAAGDLAFVGYISADDGVNGSTQDDEFSFILLKDINSGTIINFTDFGWLTAGAFQTANPCGANTGAINDGIIRWTSTSALTCGTQIRIKCKYGLTATTGTVTGIQACNNDAAAFLSLSIGGDQIFAYQGLHTSPTLIAGISLNKAWDASLVACFFSSNSSVLPAALASANNTAITAGINAKYNCSTANNIPAVLIPAINNAANWNTDNTFAPPVPVAFNLPLACSFSCVAGPTIFASPVTGTITACAGTASVDPDLQQFSVSGAQLTGNINITAPTNFQISTTIGSGYTGSITLTQSGGIVTATTIYVRSAATAPAGPISGNVNLTSAGATAVDVAVSGTINPIPDAIATPASQTVCSGTPITSIVVSGAVPSTTFNWSRDNTVAVTGIAANGSGDISGTLVNTTGSPVTVAFTITPIANGCTGTPITATVLVNPAPNATITGGNNITCQGVTTTLSSPNIPGVTYNWERSLSGLTGSFSAAGSGPTLGVTSSGIYRFVATDGNGCSATSDTNNVTVADYVFNGSLAAGDAQQTGRLNRFAALSTCAVPKVCPGTFTTTGSRYYDVYSITNPRAVPVCATIGIASGCGTSIFSVAYLGSFDPLNLCTNYLADPGSSFPGVAYYEATIPAGATIQIVVHEVNVGTGCGNYTVTVDLPRDPSAATPVPASINCGGSSIITASLATSYLWSPGGQTTQSITVSPLTTTNYSVTLGYGNNGCTATANTTVTVVSTPPTISCPGNITLANTTGLCGRAVTYTTVPGGTPAPTLTYTFTGATTASGSGDGSGSFFNKGTTTVTVTATNACGNSSCSFTVTINDTEAPAITCPAPVTVSCATAVPAANIASVIATDNCPGVVVTHRGDVISSQTCANRFIITRTYRATDAANNFTECTQTITVNDVTPPVITCPAALTVSCASAVPAPNTALVTATDNCAGAVTIIFISDVISNQTCANRYLVTRTYRATDVCGNFADCTQTITVNDVTPPVITCPAALTVSCASAVPAPNTALVTATDNCAGAVTITFISDVISNQTCANRYLVTRTYRATDVCGNFADCTQTITVNDVTPPVITCPAAVTVSCASAVPAPNTALVTATDNCAGAVTITFVNDVISGQTCPNRYTVTRTYRATDVCGNSSTCTQIITVNDQTAPVLTCPANINVLTPIGSCTAIVNFTPTATDNCNGAVTIVSVPASGSVFPIGTTTVNVTATDACGNSSTCSFTVTVVDAQLPVISQQPLTKFVCDGTNAVFTVVSTNALSYQWQQWNGTAWVNIAGATTATLTINAASFTQNTNTYRVAVIGLCTTVQSAAASLYVNPLPTVNLSTSIPPFLSPGQSMSILSSVSPSGGTYRWFLNGSLISAAQGSSLNGITVDGQGTYRLVYTDPNGCTNNSIDIVVVGQQSNDLWIYPNPNQGSFNVRFFNKAGEKVTVNVMDAKGRRVYSKEFTTVNAYTNMLVDLAAKGMADGTYFVTVVGQNGSIIGSKKILVYRR